VTLSGKFDSEFVRARKQYAGTGTLRASWRAPRWFA
jgi:hypothetical protein